MKFSKLFLVALLGVLIVSCEKDDVPPIVADYEKGIIILNEGNGTSGGSISFISNDLATLNNEVYKSVNNDDFIGKFVQSVFFNGDNAYIIGGGSNVINVVNRYTFKIVGKIETGLVAPRYGVVKDGKAYVTNANTYFDKNSAPEGNTDDYVAVIDLMSNTIESTIALNATADRISIKNNKLYITEPFNSTNVIVVNTDTNTLEGPINVGAGAGSMEIKDDILYVLSSDKVIKISLSDNSLSTINFPGDQSGAKHLDIEGDKIYYTINNAVYAMDISATTGAADPIFSYTTTSQWGKMYGFAVKNDRIFIGDGGDFASNSKAYVYSTSGNLIKELTVGIAPNGFYFNN